jgi:hypothetical protein
MTAHHKVIGLQLPKREKIRGTFPPGQLALQGTDKRLTEELAKRYEYQNGNAASASESPDRTFRP